MGWELALAIYGAAFSTILGALRLFEYFKSKQVDLDVSLEEDYWDMAGVYIEDGLAIEIVNRSEFPVPLKAVFLSGLGIAAMTHEESDSIGVSIHICEHILNEIRCGLPDPIVPLGRYLLPYNPAEVGRFLMEEHFVRAVSLQAHVLDNKDKDFESKVHLVDILELISRAPVQITPEFVAPPIRR
jgi:hypothetical protein